VESSGGKEFQGGRCRAIKGKKVKSSGRKGKGKTLQKNHGTKVSVSVGKLVGPSVVSPESGGTRSGREPIGGRLGKTPIW